MSFAHQPVLRDQVLSLLAVRPGGTYVDCTVGGGGHAREIAARLGPGGRLIGLDQDPTALAAAEAALAPFGPAVTLVHANFRHLGTVLAQLGVVRVDGVLMDIGVSSPQLDEAERGFSYHRDAPLDMRMDPTAEVSARDLVARSTEGELQRLIADYGEERFARRIARAIVAARQRGPLETTGQLAAIVRDAVPAPARREGHPARRTFQALRIAVNDELGALAIGLQAAFDHLAPGGRLAVITFHSLEDRIVKQAMVAWARGCICPPRQPVCTCGRTPAARLVTKKPATAPAAEVAANPRARSAKLRVAERL